jgi:quinolinate synthase
MGRNLAQLFAQLATLPAEEVAALHPGHTPASIAAALPRLRYFEDGTCIVHHIFGGEACEVVRAAYGDAYLTAHFEVPGDMFTLAMAARARGMGVVGSTSNILDFIAAKLGDALAREGQADHLRFVLGTESGMVTSIVRRVQSMLRTSGRHDVSVEVVFPVNPSAITTPAQRTSGAVGVAAAQMLPGGLAVLPGPAMGEGCSLEGGCASCPYMRMNTLGALLAVCSALPAAHDVSLQAPAATPPQLLPYLPKPYAERMPDGSTVARAGCVPILHMRHFHANKTLSEELVADITTRHKAAC